MVYIQRKDSNYLETVDEFPTWKEARSMVKEYRLGDPSALYYLSSRCCKAYDVLNAFIAGIEFEQNKDM